jgi:ion channel-forming bestrophin family protein
MHANREVTLMVSNRGSVLGLMRWQGRNVATFAITGAAVVVAHELHRYYALPELFRLPALPVAVVGGAIGIFVSFRSNAGYDRWWEGRKLWGKLVNTSRHWSTQVLAWCADRPTAERLIHRQIAYVHLLRVLMREEDPAADEELQRWLTDEERAALPGWTNPTHALLHLQALAVTDLANRGAINELRLQRFDQTLDDLLDVQGGCERIKRTPVPRGYGFIAEQLVRLYSILLPFAVVHELLWLTIPVNVLICLSFLLISEAGRVLEDPFSVFWNGLPLSAISRVIERDLRNRLGEEDLPPPLKPGPNGILM